MSRIAAELLEHNNSFILVFHIGGAIDRIETTIRTVKYEEEMIFLLDTRDFVVLGEFLT